MSQVVRLWSQISFLFSIYFIVLFLYWHTNRRAVQNSWDCRAWTQHINYGQGGSGKSYLINSIVKSFRTKVKMLPSWNACEFLSGGFSRQIVNSVTFHAWSVTICLPFTPPRHSSFCHVHAIVRIVQWEENSEMRLAYLTIILRNRAEYHLILSRRGRRPSWLNQGIFRKIEQDNCLLFNKFPSTK